MKKAFLKQGLTKEVNYIDAITGELLHSEENSYKYLANTKEQFYHIYASILSIFYKIEQSEIRVFAYLLRYAQGVTFQVGKPMRIEIAKVTELAERTVYLAVKSLEEKKLIFKHESGVYQINPRYAYFGSSADRDKELKTVIELHCANC